LARDLGKMHDLTGQLSLCIPARGSFKSPDDYISLFISWLSKRTRYLRTEAGKHIFEGGVLSALGVPISEGALVSLSFSFRDATPEFLDELLVAATNEYATCTMRISMRFEGEISKVRGLLKESSGDFSETEEGNFSGSLSLHGQVVRVNAYPSVNRLNLECTLGRWSGTPSVLIRSLLVGKAPTSVFRRLFGR